MLRPVGVACRRRPPLALTARPPQPRGHPRRQCGAANRQSSALAAANSGGPGDFVLQPELRGESLLLRPLVATDLEPLYRWASDELLNLWANHPSNDRYQREMFQQWFADALDYESTLVVVDQRSGDTIGSSRFYLLNAAKLEVAIGFTWLARPRWGGATNAELKRLMLAHAFAQVVGIETVTFHIAPSNIRSQMATAKIGARFSHSEVVPALGDAEQLCFELTRDMYNEIIARD